MFTEGHVYFLVGILGFLIGFMVCWVIMITEVSIPSNNSSDIGNMTVIHNSPNIPREGVQECGGFVPKSVEYHSGGGVKAVTCSDVRWEP